MDMRRQVTATALALLVLASTLAAAPASASDGDRWGPPPLPRDEAVYLVVAPEGWESFLDDVPGEGKRIALARILQKGPMRCLHAAVDGLVALGGDASVRALEEGSKRPGYRRGCAGGLGRLGDAAGFDLLAGFLDEASPPPDLVEGLGRTGDERAQPLLLALLHRPHLAGAALRGLGRTKEERFLPILLGALLHDRHWASALDGIALLDSPKALPFLKRFVAAARSGGYGDRAARGSWIASALEAR